MSGLIIVLGLIGLLYLWLHKDRDMREHMGMAITMVSVCTGAFLVGGCTKGDAAVHEQQVHWGVSYAPGYVFLEVDVRGDEEQVTALVLTYDRQVRSQDYADHCIAVQGAGGGATWGVAPAGDKCVLSWGGTGALTKGKHTLVLQYAVRGSMHSAVDSTPVVLRCQVK